MNEYGGDLLGDTQLTKGILEGCVLAIVARGETYGYKILSELEAHGFSNVLEGTLYPVLTRLEEKGCISCRRGKSPYGPIRKYYSVTDFGRQYFSEFERSYKSITAAADSILDDMNNVDKSNGENET